jgi:prefoldin subunit 5
MPLLRLKLNSGDPVDAGRAIYTLVKQIERLEDKIDQIEKELKKLKGEPEQTQ